MYCYIMQKEIKHSNVLKREKTTSSIATAALSHKNISFKSDTFSTVLY